MIYPIKYFLTAFRLTLGLSNVYPESETGKSGEGNKEKTKPSTNEDENTTSTTQRPLVTTQPNLPGRDDEKTVPPPIESDPRVSWIYRLQKHELQKEMSLLNIPTQGTVEELRKRFARFLRTGPHDPLLPGADSGDAVAKIGQLRYQNTSPRTYAQAAGNVTGTIDEARSVTPPLYEYNKIDNIQEQLGNQNENVNIREILGLPPNADFDVVRRKLAAISRSNTRDHERSQEQFYENYPNDLLTGGMRQNTQRYETTRRKATDVAELCNLVRKWNLKFDGGHGAISFLERLHELIEAYGVEPNDVLKALPELLKDQALMWQRNNKEFWHCFNDFKRDFELHFLPAAYYQKMDDEIRRRTQGERELVKQYVVAISTLIRRRGTYSEEEKLERIYANMRPEYKMYVRRKDFSTIGEMIRAAEEYESYERELKNYNPPPNPAQALVPETAYRHQKARGPTYDTAVLSDIKKDHNTNVRQGGRDGQPKRFEINQKQNQYQRAYGEYQPFKRGEQSNELPRQNERTRGNREQQGVPICWNCDRSGHLYRDCGQPKKLRCYYCKRPDIKTHECSCRSGNDRRTLEARGRQGPQ